MLALAYITIQCNAIWRSRKGQLWWHTIQGPHVKTPWHWLAYKYNARPSFEELEKDNFDGIQFKGPMLGHPGSGIRYNARLPFEELEKDNFESKYFSSSKGSYNYNFTASDYNWHWHSDIDTKQDNDWKHQLWCRFHFRSTSTFSYIGNALMI